MTRSFDPDGPPIVGRFFLMQSDSAARSRKLAVSACSTDLPNLTFFFRPLPFSRARRIVALDRLRENYHHLHRRAGGAELWPVVKANAYGCGVQQIAPCLVEEGARHFFVSDAREGVQLREILCDMPGQKCRQRRRQTETPAIYILSGPFEGEVPLFHQYALTPVLNSLYQIDLWARKGKKKPALLHFDTGMNRLGIPMAWAELWAQQSRGDSAAENTTEHTPPPPPGSGDTLHNSPSPAFPFPFPVEACLSHFVYTQTQALGFSATQCEQMQSVRQAFPEAKMMLCNSAGIFWNHRPFLFDAVRPGLALYGVHPCPEKKMPETVPESLAEARRETNVSFLREFPRAILRVTAPILDVRRVHKNETVSYEGTWRAPRASVIAVVGFGYADGYPWGASNRACAVAEGFSLPLRGRVTMDYSLFDLTAYMAHHSTPPQELELLGDAYTVQDLGEASHTSPYEILCRLGAANRAETHYTNRT